MIKSKSKPRIRVGRSSTQIPSFRGRTMIQEIAADHALQVTHGKKQLLDRATGALHQEHEKQHQDREPDERV